MAFETCYVCDKTDSLYYVYPFMGSLTAGAKLCAGHRDQMVQNPEEFKKLVDKIEQKSSHSRRKH